MNDTMKALQPEERGKAFAFGLNPYGLTYHLGLQGAGGPRGNPKGAGLEGFIAIATELGASVLEIYDPWLRAMSDDELRALRDRLAHLGMAPIVSSGLMMGPFDSALRSARILDAKVIRHGLTTVLCGDRHALGEKWKELVAHVRAELDDRGPRAADEGRVLAIENHQDFGSDELAEFCETTRGLGVCLDTGNTFPVAEAPRRPGDIMTMIADASRIRATLEELITEYAGSNHGIEIRQVAGGYRMSTKPDQHDVVRAFATSLKPPFRLSLAPVRRSRTKTPTYPKSTATSLAPKTSHAPPVRWSRAAEVAKPSRMLARAAGAVGAECCARTFQTVRWLPTLGRAVARAVARAARATERAGAPRATGLALHVVAAGWELTERTTR